MILVVGHRGAAGLEPENTLRGFARALELGVDAVELDVRMTRDGEAVVMHDARVDRTTDGSGRVRKLSLERVRTLNAGQGERVPTLAEILDLVGRRVEVLCELKGAVKAPLVEEEALRVVAASGCAPVVVFTAMRAERLERVRRLEPAARVEPLFRRRPDKSELGALLPLGCVRIGVRHDAVDASLVRAAGAMGLVVRAWNPDSPEEWQRLLDAGVAAIGTNRPDALIQWLRRTGRRPQRAVGC